MLTISVVRNIDYYTDLSAEDYYASGSEPEGSWEGKGSTLLGLSGKVEVAVYRKVLEGLSPNGDEKLVANPGEGHRPGWDLTFSAPKSVSLMWAGSSEPVRESISKLHHKAVRSAIKLLEDEAAETRRGADGVKREKTVGLTAITFEHCVSRALDPQLHTHCLIANVAPRYDGSWGTIESRNLYQWQRAAGAAYRAELAFGLTSLGIEIELQDDAFRVSKIPESVCEEFSKRSAVIREALKKYGGIRSGSKLGDLISLYTREKKTTYERADLLKDWQARLSQFGLTPDHLGSTDPQFVKSRLSIDSGKQALTSNMLESLTEQKTVFRKQDVFQACFKLALSQRLSAKEAASIAFDALSHAHTVSLGLDERNNQVFTTFRALQEEQEMLESAKSLSSQKHFGVDDELVALSMSRQSIQLSEEQIEGIWSVCGQTSLAILQGSAGAGKSASMKCVREVYERSGFKVLGGAVAKLAADNLNRETGITSHTVAKILSDLDAGRFEFNEKVVLIVDEAGQLGVSQLARLLAEAEKASSKIVLVGEDKQLDSIQQGGSLRYLSRSDIIGASRVETIRRQREEWARVAVADLRDGNAEKALREYDARGLLHFCKDSESVKERLVEDWWKYQSDFPSRKSLIMAQRWADVSEISERVRSILKSEGIVKEEEFLLKNSFSNRASSIFLADGDRVRLTKNDYKVGVSNGDLGTVTSIERLRDGVVGARILLDRGGVFYFRSDSYCNDAGEAYLTHAYATTVYASQGLTVDGDTFVYYTSGMDRANSYVACSRHKDACHLYVNQLEFAEQKGQTQATYRGELAQLASFMSRDRYQTLASEIIERNGLQIDITNGTSKEKALEVSL